MQEEFFNVMCARCGVKHMSGQKAIRAWTHAGAIKKATVQCDGIAHTDKGPTATMCATPETRDRLEAYARR